MKRWKAPTILCAGWTGILCSHAKRRLRLALACVYLCALNVHLARADDIAQTYRWATFDTYDNGNGSWLMGNNASMYGGVNPSNWTDNSYTAGQMSTDPAVLATLFTNKGYAASNAMIMSDVNNYYSSTNGKIAAALFQVKNTTGSPIVWSPSWYYSAYGGYSERASVAVNGTNVATFTNTGSTTTNITIPANSTSNVIFTSATGQTVSNGLPAGSSRANQLGIFNNSLAMPAGLKLVDELSAVTTNSYRWATFDTYDQGNSWLMGNNASMYGGVNPSNWTDNSFTAGQMSTSPAVLATLFTNKSYAGSNAMVMSNVDIYPSSTNGKIATALFQVKNSTNSPIVWSPSWYYSAYGAWGELASVAVNGTNVATFANSGSTTTNITIPANSTSNVIFTSATGQPAGSNGPRANQLGFFNNSLALPSGLGFVDNLNSVAKVPYRWAAFDTYDQSLGWMMGNNASMYGGVNPSNWTDNNYTPGQMSTDPAVLGTLFTNRGYAASNAMILSDVDGYYSSTDGKILAVLFEIENTTGSPIVWSPDWYYSSNPAWGETAGVAVNGVNVLSLTGFGTATGNLTIPANGISEVIFTSTSGPMNSNVRANQFGFFNDSLDLPDGLRFLDTSIAVPEPSTVLLLAMGLGGLLLGRGRRKAS